MEINIIFCLKINEIESLKPIITSILHHTKRLVKFYLICYTKDESHVLDYIKENNIKIKVGYTKFNKSEYYPLLIKKIFPDLEKVIFIDSKTLILDDIGKLYDSVEINQKNLIAYPKQTWYQILFNNYKNKIFITNLKFWNLNIQNEILKYISTGITCDQIINKTFNNKTDISIPWDNKYKSKLWNYYQKETNNFIYLLYYDDNPSNGRSKLFLKSINDLSFNLIPINVYQFEKELNLNEDQLTLGRNIRRHFSVKYFIEKNGFENYYIFADAYDIIFIKFDYQIINYIEENNIKVLYQNSTLGYSVSLLSESVVNMYKTDLFSSSFGINGGSFMGKGFNILNFYSDMFKYITNGIKLDEGLIIKSPDLYKYITIDTNYFFNINSVHKSLKSNEIENTDLKLLLDINPDIYLFHYCGKKLKCKFEELEVHLENNKIVDMKYSIVRYYFFRIYLIILPILLSIVKIVIVCIYKIINLF